MWNNTIIGEGNYGNSAVHIFNIEGDHNISHNDVSYWIHGLYLGGGMRIFKNTEEGRQLTQRIEEKQHADLIKPWLDELLLQHIDKALLRSLIDREVARAYEQGSQDRAIAIQKALGLRAD